MLLSDVRHAMACSFFLDLTAQDTGLVFFLIHLELRRHPTNLAYISSRLLGWSIVLKTSEPIWRYPVFAFICYVSIHLEISATVVRSAPEELPKRRPQGHNRRHNRSSCSHRNRCCCSDGVDETCSSWQTEWRSCRTGTVSPGCVAIRRAGRREIYGDRD